MEPADFGISLKDPFDATVPRAGAGQASVVVPDAPPGSEAQKPWFALNDVWRAPVHGIETAVRSVYNIAPMLLNADDYRWDESIIGEPESVAGEVASAIVDFTVGFIPIGGGIGNIAKLSKITVGGKGLFLKKALDAGLSFAEKRKVAGAPFAKAWVLNRHLSLGRENLTVAGRLLAGAATDFVVADPTRHQVSPLFFFLDPEAKEVIAEALDYDKEDPEWLNRLRVSSTGAALGTILDSLLWSARGVKRSFSGAKEIGEDARKLFHAVIDEEERRRVIAMGGTWSGPVGSMEAAGVDVMPAPARRASVPAEGAPGVPSKGRLEAGMEMARRAEASGTELSRAQVQAIPARTGPGWLERLRDGLKPGMFDEVVARYEKRRAIELERLSSLVGRNKELAVEGKIAPRELSDKDLLLAMLMDGDINTRMFNNERSMNDFWRAIESMGNDIFKNPSRVSVREISMSALAQLGDVGLFPVLENAVHSVTGTVDEIEEKLLYISMYKAAAMNAHSKDLYEQMKNIVKMGEGASRRDLLAFDDGLSQLNMQLKENKLEGRMLGLRLRMRREIKDDDFLRRVRERRREAWEEIANDPKLKQYASEVKAVDDAMRASSVVNNERTPLGALDGTETAMAEELARRGGAKQIVRNAEKMAAAMEKYAAVAQLPLSGVDGTAKAGNVAQALQAVALGVAEVAAPMTKLAQKTLDPRFFDFINEWMLGSLISAPRTWVGVAAAQWVWGSIVQPARLAAGAATGAGLSFLDGNYALAKQYTEAYKTGLGALVRQFDPLVVVNSLRAGRVAALEDSGFGPIRGSGNVYGRTNIRASITGDSMNRNKYLSTGVADKYVADKLNVDEDSLLVRGIRGLLTTSAGGHVGIGPAIRMGGGALRAIDAYTKHSVVQANALSMLKVRAAELFPQDANAAGAYVASQMEALLEYGQLLTTKRLDAAVENYVRRDPTFASLSKDKQAVLIASTKEKLAPYYTDVATIGDVIQNRAHVAAATSPVTEASGGGAYYYRAFLARNPSARLITPFVNAPYNILRQTAQELDAISLARYVIAQSFPKHFSAFGEGSTELLKGLTSGDPQVRSEALGRLAGAFLVVNAIASLGQQLQMDGLPTITGNGPRDPAARTTLMNLGWRPFSIHIGDSFISYQRLDPLGSIIGAIASVADYTRYHHPDEESSIRGAILATVVGISQSLLEKSYMQSLQDFVEVLSSGNVDTAGKFVRQRLAAYTIPTVVTQGLDLLAGDGFQRETYSVTQEFLRRTTFGQDKLGVARDVLGRAIPTLDYLGPDFISPLAYSQSNAKDPVRREFALIGANFAPRKRVMSDVDLAFERVNKGPNAYDRWGELVGTVKIGGRTLYDTLHRMIQRPEYKALPIGGETMLGESERERLLRVVIKNYTDMAFAAMLSENPHLAEKINRNKINKQRARFGF